MNRETRKLVNFIESNPEWKEKIKNLEKKNSKEYYFQVGYCIMDLLSTEKQFFDYPRKKIEFDKLGDYFL